MQELSKASAVTMDWIASCRQTGTWWEEQQRSQQTQQSSHTGGFWEDQAKILVTGWSRGMFGASKRPPDSRQHAHSSVRAV